MSTVVNDKVMVHQKRQGRSLHVTDMSTVVNDKFIRNLKDVLQNAMHFMNIGWSGGRVCDGCEKSGIGPCGVTIREGVTRYRHSIPSLYTVPPFRQSIPLLYTWASWVCARKGGGSLKQEMVQTEQSRADI